MNEKNSTETLQQFLKQGLQEIESLLDMLNWEIRPGSFYYIAAEIFEIYRLLVRNRIRALYYSSRFPAIREFVNKYKKHVENRKTAWTHPDAPYIQYYRHQFPQCIKPADKDVVLFKDGIPNPHFAQDLDDAEKDGGTQHAEARVLWFIGEWSNVINLSFLTERQHKIIVQILKSLRDHIRMSLWESIKFNKNITEALDAIDACFYMPITIIGKATKYPSYEWLKNIAVIEKW